MTIFITTPVIAAICVAVFVGVLLTLLVIRYRVSLFCYVNIYYHSISQWRRVHSGVQSTGYKDFFKSPQSSFRDQ